MRKLVYLFALFCTSFYYAQTNGITYQAVIYIPNGQNIPGQDIQNSPMTNRSICLQFSLIDDASQIEYQETIQTTTDDFGMVNLIIGTGTQTGGYAISFNGVIWNNTQKTLKVELDARGTCQDYIILSDNPLSAVPFAYAAVTANNVSGTVAVFNGGTGANNPTDARINLGLGNVDNTSDAAKPISTATQAALDTKEALSNKSTAPTLGTSDVLYPTQNAVKTYVDAQVASATIADADAVTKGKIQLAGDLSGTAAAPTVPALATKENIANKSTNTTLGTSDVLFPTQNAVKTYVDAQVASATIADADAVTKGKIQLAGDLSGTAAAPTVPALATKENIANKSTATTLGTSDQLFPTQNAVKTYVDTNITSVNSTITTLQGTVTANANAATTAIAAVQADVDANETAANTALALKEDAANKSTATTLGTSNQLFPTQNAVKTYVDTNITSVNSTITTLQGTVTANANAATTAIAAVQADVDANETAANTALALKEDAANKSTATTLGTSDQLFPTQNAVKTYVDAQVASATIADADAVTKGKIQLAGDLSGTAAAPTVPALVLKEDTANKSTATTLGTSDQLFPTQNAVKTYVDSNITSVNSTITTLQGTVTANANAATTAIAAVQADVDANETAANTALALKEDAANKSTATTLGTSDQLFPTQNAVKTYVDTNITSVNSTITTLQGTVTANANAATTAIAAVQADVDANETTANTALALKENSANKTLDLTTVDGTSDIKFPSAKATKDYVDSQIATGVVDASTTIKGKVQLAGDLTGTAALPEVAAGAITTAKLADDAVTTIKITDANVTTNKLAANAVTSAKILDGTILVGDLADDAVETAKIKDANVTSAKLADNAVETAKIKNANVTNAKLDKANIPLSGFGAATADVDLGSNKLTNVTDPASAQDAATKNYVDTATSNITTLTDGKIYVGNASNEATQVTPTGDVTITNAGVTAIGTGKVVTAMLADTAVTTAKITDANVTTAKLANDAVETAKIKNANVTNAKLDKANIPLSGFGAATADVDLGSNKLTNVTDPASAQDAATKNYVDTATSNITTLTDGKIYVGNASNEATQVTPTGDVTITNAGVTAIGTGKVVTAMLADTAVTTAKITDANVTTAKLANDAVETAKIKNANVTNAKLDKANIPLSGFGAATADVDLGSNKLTNVTDPASAQDAATKNYVDTATSNITTLTDGKIYVGNASNEATQVTPTGDVTITNAGVTAIGTGKVVTAMLADTAVTTAKITDANVTTAKLANDAVETAKIKNANVTNAKLDKANIPLSGFGAATADVDLGSNKLTNVTDPASAQDAATKNYVDTATSNITTLTDGKIYVGNASNEATQVTPTGDVTITNAGVTAIGTGKVVTAMLADTAVTTAKITDANVTTAKLANDAVETAKIKNAAVTTAKIADANVTYAKIQNVSATDKVLGRVSTGAGVIEEIATTGTGDVVRATSPTLVTPNLGTPSAIDLTNATGLPLTTGVTGILPEANGGTGSATKNFVDLTTNQTIAGVKTFSGTSTVVNQNLTVNAAGTTGQGIILSDDGDIVDNNDGAATFRFTGGVKINNGNKSAGTTTNITLSNTGNITASGSVTASQITSNVATGTAPLVVTSTTPVANLNIEGNAANVTGTVAIANGGTGQTTKAAAFNALSPMTTAGDIIYGGTSGTGTRLGIGTNGQVLTLAGGLPSWASPAGITTLAAIGSTPNANGATISGSTLNLEPANGTNGGVVTTAAQTFAGAKTFTSVLTVDPTATSTLDGATMSITGQSTTASSKVGGLISLTAGNGGIGGAGGAINIKGGTAGTNANGGDINITGGTAGAANASGGNIKLTPGGFSTTTSGTVSVVGSDLFVNNWNFRVGMGRNYLSTNTAVGIGTLQASGLSGGSNVAMGMSSLTANTTGAGNTALGTSSLFTNLDGNYNTAVGNNSLNKNESGGNNVAIGYRALQANTTGINNVGVGSNAISEGNTTTSNNVGIGYYAMRYNNGNNNIAVGYYAGGGLGYNSSTAGGNNVFIGHQAGYSAGPSTGSSINTTGSNSVMIGYDVRPAATGETNQIVISGYNGTASTVGQGANTTSIGNSATTRAVIYGSILSNLPSISTTGSGGDFTIEAQDAIATGNTNGGNINLSPGSANGTGTAGIVKVNGQIQITGGTPGAGEVLVSDANGLATWSNAIGSTVVTNSTTYAITTAEAFVFYNGSANAAFTIPAASSTNQGKAITIKNKTGFGITITPASGTIYIDSANTGAANVSIGIEASNNWIKLVSDGTQWNVLRALF